MLHFSSRKIAISAKANFSQSLFCRTPAILKDKNATRRKLFTLSALIAQNLSSQQYRRRTHVSDPELGIAT